MCLPWVQTRCPLATGLNPQCTFNFNICDGKKDCPGGTDESPKFNCSTWTCAVGYIKCASSKLCVPGFYCDGLSQCPYNTSDPNAVASDEDPAFCKKYKCPAGLLKCRDGKQCIQTQSRCDNIPDCEGERGL